MFGMGMRLRRVDEEVLAKVMDGEALIINLANGTYYSTDGPGAVIWTWIEDGLSLAEICAALCERFEVSDDRAREDVLGFAQQLQEAGLVCEDDSAGARIADPPAKSERLAYAPPELHVYRDMEELLALDPPSPGLEDLRWKE